MARRVQIRPPRVGSNLNVNDTWQNVLEPAVQQVFSNESQDFIQMKLEFVQLYSAVYRLVIQGSINMLQKKLGETTSNYLRKKFDSMDRSGELTATSGNNVVITVGKLWRGFQKRVQLVNDIFLYADRDEYAQFQNTRATCNKEFREVFVLPLLEVLFTQYIYEINRHRRGENIDRDIMASVNDMFSELAMDGSPLSRQGVIEKVVSKSKDYYVEAVKQMNMLPVYEQLQMINKWLEYETTSASYWADTADAVAMYLQTDFIQDKLPLLLANADTGLNLWIDEGMFDAIGLACKLESELTENKVLEKLIIERALNDQSQINVLVTSPTEWVDRTCALLAKYDLIAQQFGKPDQQHRIITSHKQRISDWDNSGEYLASHLDEYLKKKSVNVGVSPESVQQALEAARIIYTCLQDRDEFGKIYQRLLARRLINNSSRSMVDEAQWIRIMKAENSGHDTHSFERMIADIAESRQLFHGSSDLASLNHIPTNVDVLRRNLWPRGMQPQLKYDPVLPAEIADAKSNFEQYYASQLKDTLRVLTWNYNLSNSDVKIRVGEKSYMASLPLVCMSILNLFGEDETYTAQQISDMTNIPFDGELERYLKSLYLVPGSQLLVKTPPGRDVFLDHSFTFNNNFTSPKSRIKVKIVSAKPGPAIAPEDADMLNQERSESTQAAIIRAMKAHKVLEHNELVAKTTQLLQYRFKATSRIIKKEIQNLLAKGYMERDETNDQIYRYVA